MVNLGLKNILNSLLAFVMIVAIGGCGVFKPVALPKTWNWRTTGNYYRGLV